MLASLFRLARRALVVNDLHRALVPWVFARSVFPFAFESRGQRRRRPLVDSTGLSSRRAAAGLCRGRDSAGAHRAPLSLSAAWPWPRSTRGHAGERVARDRRGRRRTRRVRRGHLPEGAGPRRAAHRRGPLPSRQGLRRERLARGLAAPPRPWAPPTASAASRPHPLRGMRLTSPDGTSFVGEYGDKPRAGLRPAAPRPGPRPARHGAGPGSRGGRRDSGHRGEDRRRGRHRPVDLA